MVNNLVGLSVAFILNNLVGFSCAFVGFLAVWFLAARIWRVQPDSRLWPNYLFLGTWGTLVVAVGYLLHVLGTPANRLEFYTVFFVGMGAPLVILVLSLSYQRRRQGS